MKRMSRIIAYVFCLVILVLWVSYTMIKQSATKEQLNISVVLTGSEEDRWVAVKNGMEQAALDYGVVLTYPIVEQHPSTNDEWDIMAVEYYANGADALVVEPIGKELLSDNISSDYEIPVVFIDSDVEPQGMYTCVKADDAQIGETLADKLYEEYGSQLKNMNIGVVCGVYSRLNMNIRLKSFYDRLNEYGVRTSWTLGLGTNLKRGLDTQLKRSRPDIIVSLGNYETEMVVDKIVEHKLQHEIAIYGEGYSEKTVYYLDRNVISCLVLPDEYMLGYLAVEEATKLVKHMPSEIGKRDIELHSIRSDEVFLDENAEILFPYLE